MKIVDSAGRVLRKSTLPFTIRNYFRISLTWSIKAYSATLEMPATIVIPKNSKNFWGPRKFNF